MKSVEAITLPVSSSVDSIHSSTPRNSAIPRLEEQADTLIIDIDKNNTIANCGVGKTVIIIMYCIAVVMHLIGLTMHSLILRTVGSIISTISFILFIPYFNIYIAKQGIKSFTFWYKVIHVIIAVIARQMYYNSYITSNSQKT